MTDAPPPASVACAACGAEHEGTPPANCWVCGLPFRAAPAPAAAVGPVPARPVSSRRRWEKTSSPALSSGAVLALAIVFGGIIFVQPGLGILLAICGLPMILAIRGNRGAMGCLVGGLIAIGILLATVVAFFITCSAIYSERRGNDSGDAAMTIASLVAVGVFVGLTFLAVRGGRGRERGGAFHAPLRGSRAPRSRRPDHPEAP